MYAIAIHAISDPDKFWGGAADLQLPEGTTLHSAIPNGDGTRAVCVWEADSVDTVRDFVESIAGDISQNEYYEVNEGMATGLPASSMTAAR